MNYGAVILAGGKSSRMGVDKAGLMLNGVRFLDKLAFELSDFHELLVSVDDAGKHPEITYPMVSDILTGCGPMGGLYASLTACESDALVTVPCDVPLFTKAIADALCACLNQNPDADAVITVTDDDREHPLCGIYRKSCLPILEQCLKEKNYKVRDFLSRVDVKRYSAGKNSWRFNNINTPEDFHKLKRKNCLAVCGWKNAGKTTLIEKLIPLLTEHGLNVVTVKHDGHHYEPDVPGTDSYRFFQAGAAASIIYDEHKYSLTRRCHITDEDVQDLAPEADILLLEGFKWTSYPKMEIIRKENGKLPIPDLQGRIAYITDMDLHEHLPVLNLEAIQEIAAFIIAAYEKGTLKERW